MSGRRPVTILIGVGTNIDPERNASFALRRLRRLFPEIQCATFYRTKPIGPPSQPPYINGVVATRTDLEVPAVRTALKEIERDSGRTAEKRKSWAPRTLDLDLLTYGDEIRPEQGLPHPDLKNRDFVLLPAAELRPDWVHPEFGLPLRKLAAELFPTAPNILAPINLAAL